jgi:hypothetical protein
VKLLGIIVLDFDVTDQLLIRLSAFFRYWRNWEHNGGEEEHVQVIGRKSGRKIKTCGWISLILVLD